MAQCQNTTKDGKVRCQGSVGHQGAHFFGGVTLADFDTANSARHEEALRPALVRALEDVKRGNENIEKLLAELKAERAAWAAIKAYINVRSGQPTMSRACEDILDEMDRLERP